MTGEIHSHKTRALTQEWAAAFRRDGFDGVRYFASNDPSLEQVCIALFDAAGEQKWPIAATHELTATFLAEVESRYGVKVR